MEQFANYDFNIEKIVLACFVPGGTGKVTHKNRPSHGLALHVDGEKEHIFSSGEKIVVKQNEIIYLPKGSDYTVKVISPGDCYAINFDISENISFPPIRFSCKNTSSFIKYFKSATGCWANKKNGFALKCKAELYNILYAIQSEYFSDYLPKGKFEIIRQGCEYIHSNYCREIISVEALAKMCNISPEYFRKIFKSFYGVSPVQYIANLKLTHAKELIESGLYSVTTAAEASGFSDMSYFSREFKKAFDISPREYKKQISYM